MTRNGFQSPLTLDRVHQGDCLDLLARLPDGAAHLAFADPPFNIGYDYDTYDDNRSAAYSSPIASQNVPAGASTRRISAIQRRDQAR